MQDASKFRPRTQAQTLIFFALAMGLIFLLCGFAIDSGLLYLAKARLSRAVDGAALAAVGNFQQSSDPTSNRDAVAQIMRNFAIANYRDLGTIGSSAVGTPSTYTASNGTSETEYTYTFYDNNAGTGGIDANGAYRRYVQVVLQTGSGGQITSGQCNARCPAHTYFIGIVTGFQDLKVSSSAIATRNPRLIMVVVDRSASMLFGGGGAFGLPAAITTFLNFFDTSSDYIGLVSFSSAARVEMPLTTNFLVAGTNDLYDTYQIDNDGSAIPGVDPEEYTNYDNYTTNDVRRMKFGGQTAADEGLRLALEQLMENPGFTNPNVVKYIVLFTDGAWNTCRTMVAAPGYTNVIGYPQPSSGNVLTPTLYAEALTTAQYAHLNPYLPVPTLSPEPSYSNAIQLATPPGAGSFDYDDHTNDTWQSADGVNEPIGGGSAVVGHTISLTNSAYLFTDAYYGYGNIYTPYLNVWVPPGAVDYVYTNGVASPVQTIVSSATNAGLTTNILLNPGETNYLVVPGYVAEGIISDSLDLAYPNNVAYGGSTYPDYRNDNYNQAFMWPDDTNAPTTTAQYNNYTNSASAMRNLMFRNYANLLTGYYVMRPDDPSGASTDIDPNTEAVRPLNGNGAYYPSAAFYWPFDLVGIDQYANFSLRDAISDPDPTDTGSARFISYSINMLSSNAAPEWSGELFYEGTQGTSVYSAGTAVSTQMTASSQWQVSYPSFVTPFVTAGLMTNETSHFPTNIGGAVWRPLSFTGSNSYSGTVSSLSQVSLSDSLNKTGGYVTAENGVTYRNSMAYAGRPTHYFDFSTSQWKAIPDNHLGVVALALGNWKAREYAWHARAAGVTIYTVGYGSDVTPAEQILLAQVANATNSTANPATNLPYIGTQPIGQQFYATTPADISNDFYEVGTAINGALTQ